MQIPTDPIELLKEYDSVVHTIFILEKNAPDTGMSSLYGYKIKLRENIYKMMTADQTGEPSRLMETE